MLLKTDVAIVGAGPGGLTAAHALRAVAPGLKVMVFEKSAADLMTTRRGAGLGVDVNGQKALEAIQPELHRSLMRMASFPRTNKVVRPDGSEVADVPYLSEIRAHYCQQGYDTPCLLGWSDLQRMLAKALPANVPITTGMEFERYETSPDDSSITAYFKPSAGVNSVDNNSSSRLRAGDGSSYSKSASGDDGRVAVQAKLLVASDGYFSRVRRQCLDDGPPQWDDTVVWRARLPRSDAAAVGVDLVDSTLYMQDVGRYMLAYPISSGDIVWTLGCKDEKLSEMGLDSKAIQQQLSSGSLTSKVMGYSLMQPDNTHGYCPQEIAAGQAAKARCLQAMAGVSESVLGLIEVTPPSSLVEHGVYIRPVSTVSPDSFGRGRVVIMGDAAHPMRPTGQGYNQTVEDAYGLGVAMAGSGGAIDLKRIQEWREVRANRIKPVVAFTTETGRATYNVLKKAMSDEEAAHMTIGTGDMSNEQYERYLYDCEFESLVGASVIARG